MAWRLHADCGDFLWRHFSLQYFTSSQLFAQALRHVIGLPQAAHGLLGRDDLLPLNAVLIAAFLRWMAISTV